MVVEMNEARGVVVPPNHSHQIPSLPSNPPIQPLAPQIIRTHYTRQQQACWSSSWYEVQYVCWPFGRAQCGASQGRVFSSPRLVLLSIHGMHFC